MDKIKVIFFDLDDTLVDSKKAERDASIEFKKQFSEFNKIDDEYFANLWHKIAVEQYERYRNGEISYDKQKIERIKILFSIFGIKKNDKNAEELFSNYLTMYEKNWKLFDDTKKYLHILKQKYKLGIITNGDGKQQRKKIKLTKLDDIFSNIIISGEVNVSKPDKKIFDIACQTINEKPNKCIMIGDNYNFDIQGAINAGLDAIWINRNNENIEYKNQITNIKELLNKF